MAREILTDEQVELEIARLKDSEYVKLARRYRDRRRQALYNLRHLEKKGRELAAQGYTLADMELEVEV